MSTINIIEWGIVLYYVVIVGLAISNLRFSHTKIFRRLEVGQTKISTMQLVLWLMIASGSLYVWLQVDWILTSNGSEMHGKKHIAWMVFEYLVATNGLVTNVLISHQLRAACQKCSVYRALTERRNADRIPSRSTDR